MKKAVAIICTIVIFVFSLIGCGDKDTVAYNLKLNVSSGEVVESFDMHGGFNGDGATFAKIKFSDDSALAQIENNNVWTQLPSDETVQALLYGDYSGFVCDENGNSLIPEIKNGYSMLIDKQDDSLTNMLERASLNFVLGVYDTDTNTLYYYELDT